MANSKQSGQLDTTNQSTEPGSSHGDNSVSVTPKDVAPHHATSKDIKERKIASADTDEQVEELLDDAVEMTFPASDPIAIPDPGKLEKHKAGNRNA